MPRYRRPPLTLSEICREGPPLRLRDLLNVTGLSDITIRREINAGSLQAHKLRQELKNSTYFVDRAEARRWLVQIGFLGSARST